MFRRALSALGLSATQEMLTEREFGERCLSAVIEAHPHIEFEIVSDLSFLLNPRQDKEHRVELTHLYGIYQMDPDRLEVLIQLNTTSVNEGLTLVHVEMTADMLVPLVRSARDIEALDSDDVITDPLTNDLIVVYAFDLPHTLKYVTPEMLQTLGIAREDLKARAVQNVERSMDKAVVDLHEGVVLVSSEAINPTALLFCPAFWQQGVFADMPNIAVIVPDRQMIVAFDADSQEAILGAGSVASEILAHSNAPMSKEVMLIKADPSVVEQPAPRASERGGFNTSR